MIILFNIPMFMSDINRGTILLLHWFGAFKCMYYSYYAGLNFYIRNDQMI